MRRLPARRHRNAPLSKRPNLVSWGARISIEPNQLPANRPVITYQMRVRCPSCHQIHSRTSPPFPLVERGKRRAAQTRMYYMTLELPNGAREVIEWVVRANIGRDSVHFFSDHWCCQHCGSYFGLDELSRRCGLRQLTERITVGWAESEIRRLEALATTTPPAVGRRFRHVR